MLSHPGRLGGERMIPVLLFKGPPQLIPIPCIFREPSAMPTQESISSASKSSICGGVCSAVFLTQHLCIISAPDSVISPKLTAHLVPPISTPITNILSPLLYISFPPAKRRSKTRQALPYNGASNPNGDFCTRIFR